MNHIEEWKKIKGYYKYMIDNNYTENATKEQYKFRIECINDLIESEEKEKKDIAHFR